MAIVLGSSQRGVEIQGFHFTTGERAEEYSTPTTEMSIDVHFQRLPFYVSWSGRLFLGAGQQLVPQTVTSRSTSAHAAW
jgi:hypothetical protein